MDIDTMEAADLGLAVVVKVMRWPAIGEDDAFRHYKEYGGVIYHDTPMIFRRGTIPDFWYPWRDIRDAWNVFEWLAQRGIVRLSNGDGDSCDCDFMPDGRDEVMYGTRLSAAHVTEETYPIAICRAALKAVGSR